MLAQTNAIMANLSVYIAFKQWQNAFVLEPFKMGPLHGCDIVSDYSIAILR